MFFNNDGFDRHNVHLRMLAILGSDINKGESPTMALTEVVFNFVVALLMFLLFLFSFVVFLSSIFPNPEMRHILFKEHCICDFDWFGCIFVMGVEVFNILPHFILLYLNLPFLRLSK